MIFSPFREFDSFYADSNRRWLMQHDRGTKKIKYLEENLNALNIQISEAENKEIREAIAKVEPVGERYPAG